MGERFDVAGLVVSFPVEHRLGPFADHEVCFDAEVAQTLEEPDPEDHTGGAGHSDYDVLLCLGARGGLRV